MNKLTAILKIRPMRIFILISHSFLFALTIKGQMSSSSAIDIVERRAIDIEKRRVDSVKSITSILYNLNEKNEVTSKSSMGRKVYDKAGNLIQEIRCRLEYDDLPICGDSIIYKYDENNNLIESIAYIKTAAYEHVDLHAKKDVYNLIHHYKYNSNNSLIEHKYFQTHYRKDSNDTLIDQSEKNVYDLENRLVEQEIYDLGRRTTYNVRYIYNENSDIKKYNVYAFGSLAYTVENKYDSNNRIIEKIGTHTKRGTFKREKYTYNEKGQLTEIQTTFKYDPNCWGVTKSIKKYYKYDEEGNKTNEDIWEYINLSNGEEDVDHIRYTYNETGQLLEEKRDVYTPIVIKYTYEYY